MNSLRGLGICALLAALAYALTQVADVDQLLLAFTVVVISVSLFTYAASTRRRRHDRRIAAGE
ncbi:hypothetical protein A8W25_12495 [Streptomyces sp. ERV7]|uniref:hypothetical protein n=1 Tax=Streptomyces sp. ERV7 TaxID=1322334 RepID=UPI0007F43511|nr:hypothetical protein [Streptomyces sp. ERV7]OAR26248.1 hypothetical protein A8W25_12495 [Streptomyces sp. ERV7]